MLDFKLVTEPLLVITSTQQSAANRIALELSLIRYARKTKDSIKLRNMAADLMVDLAVLGGEIDVSGEAIVEDYR